MNTKEELKRKFNLETYGMVTDYDRKKLWEFFWSEIEQKDQQWLANNKLKEEAIKLYQEANQAFKDEEQTNKNLSLICEDLQAKIAQLESEIEAREKAHKIELSNFAYQTDLAKKERDQAETKISHLQSNLEAADSYIDLVNQKTTGDYAEWFASKNEALEKYNQLKTKSQS